MGKKLGNILVWTLLVLSICQTGYADPGGLAISAKAGTLGLGGELIANIAPRINTRLGANFLSLNLDGTQSDIEYDFSLDLLSFSALLDWHVFGGSFRVSGGLLVNQNEADLQAKLAGNVTIGGHEYTPGEIGTLSGNLTYDNQIAPYVGIGWGNALGSKGRFGFMCDLGAAYTGSPAIALSASNPAVSADDLRAEEADIEDGLKPFKFYPVFSLSFFYRF